MKYAAFDIGNLKQLYKSSGRNFREVSDPKLTRKQSLAMRAFTQLNRERTYITIPNRLKPDYIKEVVIRHYYDNILKEPISYEFFRVMIQALDDVFMAYSDEQIRKDQG